MAAAFYSRLPFIHEEERRRTGIPKSTVRRLEILGLLLEYLVWTSSSVNLLLGLNYSKLKRLNASDHDGVLSVLLEQVICNPIEKRIHLSVAGVGSTFS
jgi:hypothetical protein